MGDIGDGRLELDELGSVIDHASSLDAPRRTELLEGNDTTTWGERLQSSGVTPWLRRHRGAIAAGTAAVLLLGAAGTAWVRSRPPEQITAVDVLVLDWTSEIGGATGVHEIAMGVLAASYRVEPRTPGHSVRILGLVGPGIRAGKVRPYATAEAAADAATADVTVVLGCDDPALGSASASDFRLLVEETDAYDRSTTGTAELPFVTAGQWNDAILGPCSQRQVTELVVPTKVAIGGSAATKTLDVAVTVHNGSPLPITLSPSPGLLTSVRLSGESTVLAKGDDGTLTMRMQLTDCSNLQLDEVYLPEDPQGGSGTSVPGLQLQVTRGDLPFGAIIVARFSAAEKAQVTALLTRMCQGLPKQTTRVLAAASAPVDPDAGFVASGDPTTGTLRMTVEVRTSAERVDLTDGVTPEDAARGERRSISTAGSAVTQGRARLLVDWTMDCSYGVNPPVVQLELTSGSRSWPVREVLDDAALLAAYRTACPDIRAEDFAGMGWTTG